MLPNIHTDPSAEGERLWGWGVWVHQPKSLANNWGRRHSNRHYEARPEIKSKTKNWGDTSVVTYHRKDSADQVQVSYKIENKFFCQWKKSKYRGASKCYPKCPFQQKIIKHANTEESRAHT